jgi:hypothetical protein
MAAMIRHKVYELLMSILHVIIYAPWCWLKY